MYKLNDGAVRHKTLRLISWVKVYPSNQPDKIPS